MNLLLLIILLLVVFGSFPGYPWYGPSGAPWGYPGWGIGSGVVLIVVVLLLLRVL